jgi:hypothetical protein
MDNEIKVLVKVKNEWKLQTMVTRILSELDLHLQKSCTKLFSIHSIHQAAAYSDMFACNAGNQSKEE